jgi:hypothetical protein
MVRVPILERSLATHSLGPVLRGYAHGGGRGTCAVLAHTASRSALSEHARTTARTARHGGADRVLHRLAAGRGEYSERTHGRTAIVCAGEWCGHARPPGLGYGTRTVVAAMVRLPHCAGALADTNGPAQKRRGTRRHTNGADTQNLQQTKLRQQVRNRAGQRVRFEIPATCMVRPAVHTFHGTCTDTRKVTSDSLARTRAARVRAQRFEGALARCSHTRSHEAH